MLKKLLPLWRGLAVVFLSLLVAGVMLLDIVTQWRSTVDGFFGTQSYVIDTESGSRFQSHYDSATEMMEAAKNFAIKQGREGFVVMKNATTRCPSISRRASLCSARRPGSRTCSLRAT